MVDNNYIIEFHEWSSFHKYNRYNLYTKIKLRYLSHSQVGMYQSSRATSTKSIK